MAAHKCPVCGGRYIADVHLSPDTGVLTWPSGVATMSHQLKVLLAAFMAAPSGFISHERLIITLWGYDDGPNDEQNTAKQAVWRLQQFLKKHGVPLDIRNHWGQGFYLIQAAPTSTDGSSQTLQHASQS